ncbi:MAG: HTH domain-containing protein [Acutalibacteraceae bacterium]
MEMQNNYIEILDIPQALNKYIHQGFSIEALSKVTQISIEDLNSLAKQSEFKPKGIPEKNIIHLHIFMAQLYGVSPQDPEYFYEMVSSLIEYFNISYDAISNYIGLSTEQLKKFLDSPLTLKDREIYETKIMHLFMTFIRDIRFSIE